MRKVFCLWIAICIVLTAAPVRALADQTISAYCVITPQSPETVSSFRADDAVGVAGLVKLPAILTLCLAVDRGLLSPDTVVTVGHGAAAIGGPSAYLKQGEQIEAKELLRAAVMISAGDAIWALMENAFGSEDVFVQNINLTLKENDVEHQMQHALGTNETMSCRDLAKLGTAALKSETFLKYCSEKYAVLEHADGRKTELANANKLLTTLTGCIGLLTGSSKTDGYCGVFACKRKDTVFVCAMVGAQNSKTRFDVATKLFEDAFAAFSVFALASVDKPLIEDYPVTGGDTDTVSLYARESISLLLKKSDGEPQSEFHLPDALIAPLDTEFSVGTVSFTDRNGTLLYELALYPDRNVSATGFKEIFKRILHVYLNG